MDSFGKKLSKFFPKDQIPKIVTDKINDEYSHLQGNLERGFQPVEVPEMQDAARLILKQIDSHDEDQYDALLDNIGESRTTHKV